jgi:glycosyltransferase involved in cell wall biosynthesis
MDLKNKKLGLFFTRANSMWTWERIGHLEREVAPYNKLAEFFNEIYFFTYGDKSDLEYGRCRRNPISNGKSDFPHQRESLLAPNIKIFPKKWRVKSKIYSILLPFLRRQEIKKCDILKTNQMAGSWSAVIAKWLYKKKLVVRCGHEWLSFSEMKKRSRWWLKLIYWIEKISYNKADKIILATEADKEFVIKRFGIYADKISVIPNYIDVDLFKPKTPPNLPLSGEEAVVLPLIRGSERGFEEQEIKRICYIGRFREQKNIENLIKAVAELKVKLVIFGIGALGDKLKKIVKELSAPVEFRGTIPNSRLPEELNGSDLFILPSLFEGNPKTLLEAMSCGLPCIGANVGGIKEIIKHKENGYLCGTDIDSIKQAIIEVLDDKKLQQKMGVNARKTVLENFSLDKNIQKEIQIYENL